MATTQLGIDTTFTLKSTSLGGLTTFLAMPHSVTRLYTLTAVAFIP